MKTISLIFWSLLTALLLTACGGEKEPQTLAEKQEKLKKLRKEMSQLQSQVSKLEKEVQSETNEDPNANLRRITAFPLSVETFRHYIEVQGSVESDENVLVTPEMSGTITKVHVKEGDRVRKGQTLISIDDAVLQTNIAELETRLQLARQTYERQKNLWDQKIGTEMQYLQAKNQVEVLEKNIASIQEQRSKTVVKAPISGTVNEVLANQGEMANPAMPVARVVSLAQVQVNADVSERYLPYLRKGDVVTVHFPVLKEEQKAKIDFVGDYIDQANRTFKIQARLQNPENKYKPNMVAMVKINDITQEKAVTVPTNLIQQSTDGSKFVWIVKGEGETRTVEKRQIVPGIAYQGQALVKEGLDGSEVLVDKGFNEVVDGEEVVVMESQDKAVALD